MILIDTNAILRYILQDNQEMADIAEQKLLNNVCFIPIEVIAEIVFVLLKVYKIERKIIDKTLVDIIEMNSIRVAESGVVRHALGVFSNSTFDFVDCLLIGYSKEEKYPVFTFDKKLSEYLAKNL